MADCIRVRGAHLHNLRNVDLDIPKNRLVVMTGLSGSGKSTLAFDTVHMEGQRQYLESLGLVTAFTTRPQVGSITGLSPSISVDQHLTNRSPRSTVGTATEVLSYLRLLWARLGRRPCPSCGKPVPPDHRVAAVADDDEDAESSSAGAVPCPHCAAPVPRPVMGDFSFNKPGGACPACTGLGTVYRVDPARLLDEDRSFAGGAVLGQNPRLTEHQTGVLRAASDHYGLAFDPDVPVRELGPAERDLLLHGVGSAEFARHVPEGAAPPRTVAGGRFEGLATALMRRHAERADDPARRARAERYLVQGPCRDCGGTRLNPAARRATVLGVTLVEAMRMPLDALLDWVAALQERVTGEEWAVTEPVVIDVRERLRRLVDVGVGYLTLGQGAPSLSAGEAQRLRLAALLGSGLTGVLYVLDEPTIGLHPADTERLVAVVRRLRDLGNTVLVIEHDPAVLRAADRLIDVGPGAGRAGGRIVAEGTPEEVAATPGSVTGDCLAGRLAVPVPERPRPPAEAELVVRGARAHNLRDVTARFPVGRLTAVAGPSGSGKSSLVFDVLERAARRALEGAGEEPGEHDGVDGLERFGRLVTIDQQPVSRLPRSNAATYSEAFTPIREAFAATAAARAGGLTAGHFSFNSAGGRCERCSGAGVLTVQMHFLPAVEVRCPACAGRRFGAEVLAVRFGGHDIAEVLGMTVDEALPLFAEVPGAGPRLQRLADVGLGYLPLGQPATTLSGGEAQRLKLAKELGRPSVSSGGVLYLLDEPTTGLHTADTARLLAVVQRLVDGGGTVVVVEHDPAVIRAADHVLDLGPAGGAAGGLLVASGTPAELAADPASPTGPFLRRSQL